MLAEVEAHPLQVQPARLDLGKIEDVVDNRQEVLAGIDHRAGVFPLPRREAAVEEQFGHAHDGVERRADFVAHVGKEVALGLAGRLDDADLLLDRVVGEGQLMRLSQEQFVHP